MTLRVRAEAKAGTTPGQGTPKGSDPYGGDDGAAGASAYAGVNYKRLEDVVVWLEPKGATDAPREMWGAESLEPLEVTIGPPAKAVRGDPPALCAGVGQTLRFRNESGAERTALSLGKGNEFRLRKIARGARAEWSAAAPGVFEVLTDAHDEPVAEVVVAPTRFVKKAKAGDDVRFGEVPAGAWVARAWHRRLPAAPAGVDVKPGGRAETTLTLTVEALPDAP